jgi:hypothetical protein
MHCTASRLAAFRFHAARSACLTACRSPDFSCTCVLPCRPQPPGTGTNEAGSACTNDAEDPIEISSSDLIFSRKVRGTLTGTPAAGDATLKFSVPGGIAAMIETMPLERAAEAYAKMMSGKARFRMVLTMA